MQDMYCNTCPSLISVFSPHQEAPRPSPSPCPSPSLSLPLSVARHLGNIHVQASAHKNSRTSAYLQALVIGFTASAFDFSQASQGRRRANLAPRPKVGSGKWEVGRRGKGRGSSTATVQYSGPVNVLRTSTLRAQFLGQGREIYLGYGYDYPRWARLGADADAR
jgi:hypothetical protein